MTYTKTIWKDQDVENPRTYTMRDNGDDTVTLLDAFGTVTELGTPVNAANMNHIEDGIAANDAAIATKQNTITGAASTITTNSLTASRALVSNSSGKVAVSAVTATELSYVHGVTSAIQTQINAKAADNAVVKLTGNQTIGGTKTFSSTIAGSINGNAATVTNGVYTTGNQTIGGTKTFSSTIAGSINGNAATVTNGVYTTGNQTIGGTKTFSSATYGTASSAVNSFITNVSITKSSSGYIELGNGDIREWGYGEFSTNKLTVNFHTPLPNSNYIVLFVDVGSEGSNLSYFKVYEKNKNYFKVQCSSSGNGDAFGWFVQAYR